VSKASEATPTENWWSRFWRLLRDFGEAMDTSAVDILHRRVSALEREVAEIRANQSRTREIP
jgi:hypothetical protein